MKETCFRMKGTTLTSIVLEVIDFESDNFEVQLSKKIASAPEFFTRSSLILHLIKPLSTAEFESLIALCRRLKLQPMAVKGEVAELKSTINDFGLADISQSKLTDSALPTQKAPSNTDKTATSNNDINASQTQQNEQSDNSPNTNSPAANSATKREPAPAVDAALKPTKVVNRPVRSGQQVYAQGSDLIVMASVSEGAELLADGNIHVYGTLRGRALAGVKGDPEARVFCQSLDAELVSIAGQFITYDTVKGDYWKKPAQVYLEEEKLRIEPLV